MAREVFERQFPVHDPHHIERLWRASYGTGFTMRPDVTVKGVLSGLEMACWEILGKAADQPVYQLLGGKVHERLRSCTYLYPPAGDVFPDPGGPNVDNDPDRAAEAVHGVRARGDLQRNGRADHHVAGGPGGLRDRAYQLLHRRAT